MKLLLTSAGITTQAIADALVAIVGTNKKVGFITTAANVEPGNKDWYIAQITNLQKYGYDWIDIIDPSAANVDWKTRLSEVGIVFVSGGNTYHLLNQANKTGFAEWLKQNVENIVYVGVSAGSLIVTNRKAFLPKDTTQAAASEPLSGLGLVGFEVLPHVTPATIQVSASYAQTIQNKLYAINDQSAISITNDKIDIIHEGDYAEYN